MVSCSPGPPSRTSWCATRPLSRTLWTRMPSTSRAAGAGELRGGGVRAGGDAGVGALGRDQLRRAHSRAGGRVDLVRVVQFNDFDGFEVLGRLGGEGGGQDRAEGEVRGDQDADAGPAGEEFLQPREPVGIPAGGADHGVHAVLDGEADVRLGAFGDGQVHHDLRAGADKRVEGVVAAKGRDERQVRGGVDGLHGLCAHAPVGAQHGD